MLLEKNTSTKQVISNHILVKCKSENKGLHFDLKMIEVSPNVEH
jgi:hypothetical protein